MRCPFCKADHDKVIDSRASEDGDSIRRRRECLKCNRRYTTYERPAEFDLKVLKKDGTREPFLPEKISKGIDIACRKRVIPEEVRRRLLMEIENEIIQTFDVEVESSEIGAIVMKHLAKVDQVAYVRFASVYREFKDLHDFVEELTNMHAKGRSSESNSGGRS